MGQSPKTDAVSLRTNNRNFFGRSGTMSAQVYLVSPEVAAVSAITGVLTNPMELGDSIDLTVEKVEKFKINDNMVIPPAPSADDVEVVRGPNIKPFPINVPLAENVEGISLIKVEDNITTDHIMPSNAKLLPYRSNIPYLSDYCLASCDSEFSKRAKENGGGFIIAGSNYGQGSSREHAALVPLYLGVKAVIAKSFARIHMANLINNGIMPLTFKNADDYDKISQGDVLCLSNIRDCILNGKDIVLTNKTQGIDIPVDIALSERQRHIMAAGGLLNYTREQI